MNIQVKGPYWPAIFRGLAVVLGASVAIVSGVIAACKYQENWLAYRTTGLPEGDDVGKIQRCVSLEVAVERRLVGSITKGLHYG